MLQSEGAVLVGFRDYEYFSSLKKNLFLKAIFQVFHLVGSS